MFSNQYVESETLPNIEGVKYEPLAHNAPWEIFWSAFIWYFIILLVAVIALTFNGVIQNPRALLGLSAFISLVLLSIWYTFASHKHKGVLLREHDVLFKKGMFWRKVTVVPFKRIQHLETHRNPIERHLNLASLKLYTAGGVGADLTISGLDLERAEKIKEFVLNKAGLSHKQALDGNLDGQ